MLFPENLIELITQEQLMDLFMVSYDDIDETLTSLNNWSISSFDD